MALLGLTSGRVGKRGGEGIIQLVKTSKQAAAILLATEVMASAAVPAMADKYEGKGFSYTALYEKDKNKPSAVPRGISTDTHLGE